MLRKLVGFNTNSQTKERYRKCAGFIANECRRIGLKTRIIYPKAKDGKPRPNVIAYLNAGSKKTVLILTHYDVVPAGDGWKTDPFKLVVMNGKAYGRGSTDDKGAIAASLSALKEIVEDRILPAINVKFACVCDEEEGGEYGAECVAKKGYAKADAIFVLDSGIEKLDIGTSGVIGGNITVYGKQGHAGYPHMCDNALEKAIILSKELMKYKKIREKKKSRLFARIKEKEKVYGRFSITTMNAGTQTNVVPGIVKFGFDLRAIPEEDTKAVMNDFKSFFKKTCKNLNIKAVLNIKSGRAASFSDNKNSFVKTLQKITKKPIGGQMGGNDGSCFAKTGKPIVSFGTGGTAHAANEYVPVKDILYVKNVVKRLCETGF